MPGVPQECRKLEIANISVVLGTGKTNKQNTHQLLLAKCWLRLLLQALFNFKRCIFIETDE